MDLKTPSNNIEKLQIFYGSQHTWPNFLGFPDYMRRGKASITWTVMFHGGGDTRKVYESLVNVNGVSIKTVHEASLKSFTFKYCGLEQR